MHLFKKTSFFLLITFLSCNAQQEEIDNSIEIIYKAQTRGNLITISYKKDKIIYISNTENKTILLTRGQQKEIQEDISKITLEEISNLKAPSDKRFTDGALSAFLIIKNSSSTFTSSDFDHKNPPKELKLLYTLLDSLIKKG